MSIHDLRKATFEQCRVSYEESTLAERLEPSIYERIGEDGLVLLSTGFYDRVFADKAAPWFLNVFASSNKKEAIENQYRFLVQTFGGPDLYRQKKGKFTRLVGRHANYNIGVEAAKRWVAHMEATLADQFADSDEIREALLKYFTYTAHYIVVASEYMRPDQLSGGTQIDEGRVW